MADRRPLRTAYQVARRRDVTLFAAGKYGGVHELRAYGGGYEGASRVSRALSAWITQGRDADADINPDLPTLRNNSRDLDRNNPLAKGLIDTKTVKGIGTGLKRHARIDREVFGFSEEEADKLERQIDREYALWWNTREVDYTRRLPGPQLERMIFRQVHLNGDVLVILPRLSRPPSPYQLKMQVIEADRLCNPDGKPDTATLSAGIERNEKGEIVRYHIAKNHPGARYRKGKNKWFEVDAFHKTLGFPNALHVLRMDRPGQSRGVPDLAPVIEPLKQLSRFTNAELLATVVSSFFTVFIKSEGGSDLAPMEPTDEVGGQSSDADYRLGPGATVGLGANESIETASPGRPNDSFDPFVQAVLRQIGAGVGIPFEIVIKHFTSSYTAARAAFLELWQYVMVDRKDHIDLFRAPIDELFLWEAAASGRLYLPGFLSDPIYRQAYCGAEYTGTTMPSLDPLKDALGAEKLIELELSTKQAEAAKINGSEWEQNNAQRRKEESRKVVPAASPVTGGISAAARDKAYLEVIHETD